ncbi:MAG: hypothetical protein OHK0017_02570 [Patescibacteria group bacterium]
MQSRIESGYLLKIRQDLVLNVSFAWFLTESQVIEIKLPSSVADSKFAAILNFGNKLQIELIKTRKHWILRQADVLFRPDFSRWDYSKFELLAELNKIILDSVHLDQDCRINDIIDRYIQVLNKPELNLPIKEAAVQFKNELLRRLGFSD